MLIPAERQDEEDKIIARLRQGERIEHFETVRIRKDGTTIDVSLTISPICDSRGRIIGASKIARDITTQKKAARRLATQYGIAQVLAESASLQEAAPKILQIVCQHPEWQLGILWRVDEEGKLLRCVEVCHAASRQSSRFEEESRRRVFRRVRDCPAAFGREGSPYGSPISCRMRIFFVKRRHWRKASAARLVFLSDLMLMFLAYWSSSVVKRGSEMRNSLK